MATVRTITIRPFGQLAILLIFALLSVALWLVTLFGLAAATMTALSLAIPIIILAILAMAAQANFVADERDDLVAIGKASDVLGYCALLLSPIGLEIAHLLSGYLGGESSLGYLLVRYALLALYVWGLVWLMRLPGHSTSLVHPPLLSIAFSLSLIVGYGYLYGFLDSIVPAFVARLNWDARTIALRWAIGAGIILCLVLIVEGVVRASSDERRSNENAFEFLHLGRVGDDWRQIGKKGGAFVAGVVRFLGLIAVAVAMNLYDARLMLRDVTGRTTFIAVLTILGIFFEYKAPAIVGALFPGELGGFDNLSYLLLTVGVFAWAGAAVVLGFHMVFERPQRTIAYVLDPILFAGFGIWGVAIFSFGINFIARLFGIHLALMGETFPGSYFLLLFTLFVFCLLSYYKGPRGWGVAATASVFLAFWRSGVGGNGQSIIRSPDRVGDHLTIWRRRGGSWYRPPCLVTRRR